MLESHPFSAKELRFEAFQTSDHLSAGTGATCSLKLMKPGATTYSDPHAGAVNLTEDASGTYHFIPDILDRDTPGINVWMATRTAGSLVDVIKLYEDVKYQPGVIESGVAVAASKTGLTVRAGFTPADNSIIGCMVSIRTATTGAPQAAIVGSIVGGVIVFTTGTQMAVTPTGTVVYDIWIAAPGIPLGKSGFIRADVPQFVDDAA